MNDSIFQHDLSLQHAVCRRLAEEIYLRKSSIVVVVKNAIVTVYGEVDTPFKKLVACNTAHHVAGVRIVKDKIIVINKSAPVDDRHSSSAATSFKDH